MSVQVGEVSAPHAIEIGSFALLDGLAELLCSRLLGCGSDERLVIVLLLAVDIRLSASTALIVFPPVDLILRR